MSPTVAEVEALRKECRNADPFIGPTDAPCIELLCDFWLAHAEGVVPLTFDAFRSANVTRCLKWHPQGIQSWSPSDWLTAVTGELGELASLLKMRNRERDGLPGNKFSPSDKQVADEIADVLTYLDLLAASIGVDLAQAAVEKFNEVSERVGFPDRIAAVSDKATMGQSMPATPPGSPPCDTPSGPSQEGAGGSAGITLSVEDAALLSHLEIVSSRMRHNAFIGADIVEDAAARIEELSAHLESRHKDVAMLHKALVQAEARAEAAELDARRYRDEIVTLLDIWDDQQLHPDHRSYVDGAFRKEMEIARAALASAPAEKPNA